jgi:uncharacterized protein
MKFKKKILKYSRVININPGKSFILFGGTGTGKTKVLGKVITPGNSIYIDLQNDETLSQCSSNPSIILNYIESLTPETKWIVINEFQKIPPILGVVNECISKYEVKFALTASNKWKVDSQALELFRKTSDVHCLFPLTHLESDEESIAKCHFRWGSLPGIIGKTDKRRIKYLHFIVRKYLDREIGSIDAVKNRADFEKFIFYAAQESGKVINAADISRKAKVPAKNITLYYKILEDTFAGFILESYLKVIRNQKLRSPKFYFGDIGLMRYFSYTIKEKFMSNSIYYRNIYKHFVINEIYRLTKYLKPDYKLYYMKTDDRREIDLVLERPGEKTVLIQLDSAFEVDEGKVKILAHITKKFPDYDSCFLSFDTKPKTIDNIQCLHWRDGLKAFGLIK